MSKNNVVLFIEGYNDPRPADIPENWEIYNAARPLCGHKHWQGKFRHGVFFVAIDPTDKFADGFRKRTIDLDGHLCKWVARDEVETWGRRYCKKYGIDYDKFEFRDIVTSFAQHWQKEQFNE